MVEILLYVVNKTAADPISELSQPKVGDVLAVKESGVKWGAGELGMDCFRIIQCPQIPYSDAVAYMNGDSVAVQLAKGPWARRRTKRLLPSKLPPNEEAKFVGPRTESNRYITLSLARVRQMVDDVPERNP